MGRMAAIGLRADACGCYSGRSNFIRLADRWRRRKVQQRSSPFLLHLDPAPPPPSHLVFRRQKLMSRSGFFGTSQGFCDQFPDSRILYDGYDHNDRILRILSQCFPNSWDNKMRSVLMRIQTSINQTDKSSCFLSLLARLISWVVN